MRKLLMLCMVVTLAPAVALAQDESEGGGSSSGGRAQKGGTTTIDFEADTIEGDLTKPDGEYVEARKKVQHSNLIRIRDDFEDKVMQSVGEL